MKRIIFVLAFIGLISFNGQSQNRKSKNEKGNALQDLKKELVKKYNYQSINVYILSTKLEIDIVDEHVKYLPKNIREIKSKEIAEFSRNFLNSTQNGQFFLRKISFIGINHLKKQIAGFFQPNNIYDSYTIKPDSVFK